MTDCGCEKTQAELEEFLRNELCRTDVADIREHLDRCSECATELQVGKILTEVVQRACAEVAPTELRSQVIRRLRQIQSAHEQADVSSSPVFSTKS